ncbi:MAG: ABC transporter ATP-binding protein [Actinomycetota bacterium]|nr:ABC transporter ATP-binding protein [Actinomycetota bacterium]
MNDTETTVDGVVSDAPVLEVDGLSTVFETPDGTVRAVDDVSLSVRPGEIVGLVGESGSGKSVTAKSILGLIPTPPGRIEGSVRFQGEDLVAASPARLRQMRGDRIAMIFQDPMTSLNPLMTVGRQITEMIRAHRDVSDAEARKRAAQLLDEVRITRPTERLSAYPHELSGGMNQRVMIAMALANDPALLIADEPTTALDVTVQAEILDLLVDLRDRTGMALLFITHDFGVVSELCDTVLVMYAGRIVERSPTDSVFDEPLHPYTRRLIDCVPRLGQPERSIDAIGGLPPRLTGHPWSACAFADRCDVVEDRCRTTPVELVDVAPGRASRCLLTTEKAAGAPAGAMAGATADTATNATGSRP